MYTNMPLLTLGEAAALLGVTRVTVWRWVRAGLLPAVRRERPIMLDAEAVRRFSQSRQAA